HRQRGSRAFLAGAEWQVVVVTYPDHGRQVAIEATEPGIAPVVGGSGLAGEVAAAERQRAPAGTAPDDVPHHVGNQVRVLLRDDARRQLYATEQLRRGDRVRPVGFAHR